MVGVPGPAAHFVGSGLPPAGGDCTFRSSRIGSSAPDGSSFGRLNRVLAGLSDFIGALFPPCNVPRVQIPSDPLSPTMRVVTVMQYRGSDGTLDVATLRPNDAALRQGMYLGQAAGALPDGTRMYALQGRGDGMPLSMLRWSERGIVIDLESEDLPLSALKLAALDVVTG